MTTHMRIADTPFLADWFVISLRWLVLLGMTVSIAIAQDFNSGTMVVLLAAAVWNIFVSLLAILNRRLSAHRLVNLAVDWAVTLLIFFGADGMRGPVLWAGLLAILPGAIYYGMPGSLVTAGMFFLLQVFWLGSYLMGEVGLPALLTQHLDLLPFIGVLAACDLFLGLVIGMLSNQVISALRRTYLTQINTIHETALKVKQDEHDRLHAFYQLLETLGATLNFQVVLETALELSADALGEKDSTTSPLVGAVLLFEETNLHVAAGRGLLPADINTIFPAERGALNKIVQHGDVELIQNPATDAELGRMTALQNCSVALALPLRRGLSSYGILLFAHADPDFFNPDRRELLEVISHQAVIAIQNARLYQDVQREKERILELEDDTRKKLARDLHDGPTQSVASIAMGLSIARRMLTYDPSRLDEELARVEELAHHTSLEIRHMLFTMRPLVLESQGLCAALQAMADKMRETYQQNVMVDVDPRIEAQLESSKQTVVFYLAEEAANNARKHAHASQITVSLQAAAGEAEMARLEVSDNGVGFDYSGVARSYDRSGSLGMVNLRERAELINGRLSIDSTPGHGTCVSVLIPLNQSTVV